MNNYFFETDKYKKGHEWSLIKISCKNKLFKGRKYGVGKIKDIRVRPTYPYFKNYMANHLRTAAKVTNHALECVFDGLILNSIQLNSIQNLRKFFFEVENNYMYILKNLVFSADVNAASSELWCNCTRYTSILILVYRFKIS